MRRLVSALALAGVLSTLLPAGVMAMTDQSVRPAWGRAQRLSGLNRFETAAEVSRSVFKPPVPVAFVATSERFPDALVGGPLAASIGAPILLVRHGVIPQVIEQELVRLRPGRIVVLGGAEAVSTEVEELLVPFATSGVVERLQGPTRYETAAEVALKAFTRPVPVAFVATGRDFPDALSGAAAAAALGGPILLSRTNDLPIATREALDTLRPSRIVVLGGSEAVTDGVKNELAFYTDAEVERWAGEDRFETSAMIASRVFAAEQTTAVFLATGSDYPDALTGAAAAGAYDAPVLLVPRFNVPDRLVEELTRLMTGGLDVFVLGGAAVVSDQVKDRVAQFANPTLSRLSGAVTDASTQGPVAGATLDLTSLTRAGESLTILSGPNGLLDFEALVWGRFRLQVSRLGYAPTTTDFELKPGEHKTTEPALERVASIHGKVVVFGTSTQVPGAQVTARRIHEGTPVGPTYEATTDASGEFLLSDADAPGGLQPGSYRVKVTHPDHDDETQMTSVTAEKWSYTEVGVVTN